MLEFTVTVSPVDYYNANAAVMSEGWSPRAVGSALVTNTLVYGAITSVAADIVTQNANSHIGFGLVVGAVAAVAIMVARFVGCWMQLPGASNRLYDQTGTLALPTLYQLDEERFRSSYAEGSSDHPWSRFCDYVDKKEVVLLRRTPGFMYVIPTEHLTAQQHTDLIALLDRVGVPRK